MIFRRAGSNAVAKVEDKSGMFYSDQPVLGLGAWHEGSIYRTVCFDVAGVQTYMQPIDFLFEISPPTMKWHSDLGCLSG